MAELLDHPLGGGHRGLTEIVRSLESTLPLARARALRGFKEPPRLTFNYQGSISAAKIRIPTKSSSQIPFLRDW